MVHESREQYLAWKRLVPFLYDSFVNHHLTWPSLSCRWGPIIDASATRRKQRLYLSEQTDGSEPNKLVVVTADIALPRVSTAEAISTWSGQAPSPFVSVPTKTLVHPGEVNKLLDLPGYPNILVTHSDTPDVYVWNLDTQPDRATGLPRGSAHENRTPSVADVTLQGHKDNAEFALGTCTSEPMIASGGRDKQVLLWNLRDSEVLTATSATGGSTLDARFHLQAHTDTVNDVSFVPGSSVELVSVSDDSSIILWDTRKGTEPVGHIASAHGKTDVHCCDWSPLRTNLLATGAADGSVRVWDRRKLQSPIISLSHHNGAVTNVEWSPHTAGVFATGDDDGLLCVWDVDAKTSEGDGPGPAKKLKVAAPPQLVFQHAGHQLAVVDFCWNPHDPWSMMSVSDDAGGGGGGTLQLWRVNDLIYRPEEDVIQELELYRDYITTGDENKLPDRQQDGNINGAPATKSEPLHEGGQSGEEQSPIAMEVVS